MTDATTPATGRVSASAVAPGVALAPFPVRQVLPWLLFAALLLLVCWYFVSAEEGATSLIAGNAVHEWMHDGRHLLGFPCH